MASERDDANVAHPGVLTDLRSNLKPGHALDTAIENHNVWPEAPRSIVGDISVDREVDRVPHLFQQEGECVKVIQVVFD